MIQIQERWIVTVGLLCLSPWLGGCKKFLSVPFRGGADTKTEAQSPFHFWVLDGGQRDEQLPPASADHLFTELVDLAGEGSLQTLTQRSIIPKTVSLTASNGKPRNLYLVWPEDSFGSSILEAHFVHQIQNSLNESEGGGQRFSVSWDQKGHRWFIFLSQLFEGNEAKVNPADIHWVNLDLLLKDGTHRWVQIGLKLAGPMPRLVSKVLEPVKVSDSEAFILREEWQNPTARKLVLWVRPLASTRLKLRVQLAIPRYSQRKYQRPSGPVYEYQNSIAPFRVSSLSVYKGSEELGEFRWPEAEAFDSQNWEKLELDPHSVLTLEWRAEPQSGLPRCTVPLPEIHEFRWTMVNCDHVYFFESDHCPLPSSSQSIQSFKKIISETWTISSTWFEGKLDREIRVTEPAEYLGLGILVGHRSIPVGLQKGEDFKPAQAFSCQGIF